MIELIEKINIEDYFGQGGVMKFKKVFGIDIYNQIMEMTKDLNSGPFINRKFRPRLIFILKYNSDIRKITKNNKVMVFKNGDFVETASNSTIKQWKQTKKILDNIKKIYTLEETINILKKDYLLYFGRSSNRKMIAKDPILYKSIYEYTSFLDNLNKNKNNLTYRMLFLKNEIFEYKCQKCNKLKSWSIKNNDLEIYCYKCAPKFPEKLWFINMYGDDWKIEYNKHFNKIKLYKTNSLDWYINRYGKSLGNKYYTERYQNHGIKLNILKNKKYSKISQILFNSIEKHLKEKNEIYYHDYNSEYYIKLPFGNKLNQTIIFVDFKYKNKIIEYHGEYWHDKEKDLIRKEVIENMGYKYLEIYSSEYNRNNINKKTIDKCLNFLMG